MTRRSGGFFQAPVRLAAATTTILVALAAGGVPADAAYSVPSSRPRLLLTADDAATLQSRALTVAPYSDVYRSLKTRTDGWASPSANRYIIGQQIQALVLVSLVEGRSSATLSRVDQWLRFLFETQDAVSLALAGDAGAIWGSADTILGVAMALDWLYPSLDLATRVRYGTYLRDYQNAVITQQGGWTRDASRSDYSNQFYYFDGMLAVSGIALYAEGIDDPAAASYLNRFDGYVRNNMLPATNQVGGSLGGYHEGLGYVDRGMTWFAVQLEAWRVGAGEDLFGQATGLRNLSRWVFHATQPDGNVVNVADVSGWPIGWNASTAVRAALLARRFREPYHQYVSNRVSPTSAWTYAVFYLLWHDSTVTEVNPAAAPLDQHFDGIGWVTMRSGFGANDVFALFTSGNYYFGHQHHDQNAFQIFRRAPLAIDSGVYNVDAPSYKTATRFHSTLLVGDPGCSTCETDGAAGQTSASPMTYVSNPEASSSDKGDIVTFDSAPAYAYVVGDASKAYSSTRLTSFVRKFLYVKPDLFVVLDVVVTPGTAYPLRWLLQSDTAPAVSGPDVTITNGSGRLFSRTLLPADAQAAAYTVFPGSANYGGGNYRVEVVPGTRRTQETFLHVLWATDTASAAMPVTRLVQSSSGTLAGAQVGSVLALMGVAGQAGTQETYAFPASGTVRHLITDVVPGGVYDVYQNGGAPGRVTASVKGVLEFTSSGGGTFIVASTGTRVDVTPPNPPTNVRVQ